MFEVITIKLRVYNSIRRLIDKGVDFAFIEERNMIPEDCPLALKTLYLIAQSAFVFHHQRIFLIHGCQVLPMREHRSS